jgi:hypothetical protein
MLIAGLPFSVLKGLGSEKLQSLFDKTANNALTFQQQ